MRAVVRAQSIQGRVRRSGRDPRPWPPQVEAATAPRRSTGAGAAAPRARRTGCPSPASAGAQRDRERDGDQRTAARRRPRPRTRPVCVDGRRRRRPRRRARRAASSGTATSRRPRRPAAPTAASSPSTATARRTRPRVTSTTPQQASTTRPARRRPAPRRCRRQRHGASPLAAVAVASAHGLLPAHRRPAPPAARPSRTTGPKVRPPARLSASAGRQQQVGVEAGAVAGVAGRALLVDLDQQGVAVAVEADLLDPLAVAGGLALDPVLLAGPAPVRRPAGGQGAVQRLVVHPAQHQHLAGVVLLHHGRHQPVGGRA